MTHSLLRDRYDQQLRTWAEVGDADKVTRIGPLWAATYSGHARGFVREAPVIARIAGWGSTGSHVSDLRRRAASHVWC